MNFFEKNRTWRAAHSSKIAYHLNSPAVLQSPSMKKKRFIHSHNSAIDGFGIIFRGLALYDCEDVLLASCLSSAIMRNWWSYCVTHSKKMIDQRTTCLKTQTSIYQASVSHHFSALDQLDADWCHTEDHVAAVLWLRSEHILNSSIVLSMWFIGILQQTKNHLTYERASLYSDQYLHRITKPPHVSCISSAAKFLISCANWFHPCGNQKFAAYLFLWDIFLVSDLLACL